MRYLLCVAWALVGCEGPPTSGDPVPWDRKPLAGGGGMTARFEADDRFATAAIRTHCLGAGLTSALGDDPRSTFLIVPGDIDVTIYRSEGGAFAPWATLPLSGVELGDSCPIEVADLDGDGRYDLALPGMRIGGGAAVLLVFFNRGGGAFERVEIVHPVLDAMPDREGIYPSAVATLRDGARALVLVGWQRGHIPAAAPSTGLGPLGNFVEYDLEQPVATVPVAIYRIQGNAGTAAGDFGPMLDGHIYAFGGLAGHGVVAAVDFGKQACVDFGDGAFRLGGPSCGALAETYTNGMGVAFIPEADGSYGAFITAIGGVAQFAWRDGRWQAPASAPLNRRHASRMWAWAPVSLFLGGRRALLVVNQFAEEGELAPDEAVGWMASIPATIDASSPRQYGVFHLLLVDDGTTLRELHLPARDIMPGTGGAVAAAMDIDGDGEPEIAFTVGQEIDARSRVIHGVRIGHLALGSPRDRGLSIRLRNPQPGTRATARCGGRVVVDELYAEAGFVVAASSELLLGCPDATQLTDLKVTSPAGETLYQAQAQPLGRQLVLPQ